VALYLKSAFPLLAKHAAIASEESNTKIAGGLIEEDDLPKNSLMPWNASFRAKTKSQNTRTTPNPAYLSR
jgi:hypothetical protein